jgi:hypothetical protein
MLKIYSVATTPTLQLRTWHMGCTVFVVDTGSHPHASGVEKLSKKIQRKMVAMGVVWKGGGPVLKLS